MSALSSQPSLSPVPRRPPAAPGGVVHSAALQAVAEKLGVSPIEAEQLRQRLVIEVERLEGDVRRVWEAHASGGSYAEIGARLGLSREQVGSLLLRARRQLRAGLAPLRS